MKILYQIKKADLGGLTKILKFFQRDDSKRTIKFGHLLLNSKNRTIYSRKDVCMGKTKSKIKKKKRRLEQKAIQNGTAKKK